MPQQTNRRFAPVSTSYTVADQQRMEKAWRYFEWQHNLVKPYLGKRVLEIGCGVGNFTRMLLDCECVAGIDVDDGVLVAHRERFRGHKHVFSHSMDAMSADFRALSRYRPDSVVCLNVLEHIEDDHLALANMHSVLAEGGRAVFIVPAFEALYGPIDVKLGHYRRYSKPALHRLAQSTGFRALRLRYMNLVGFFGWWFNARVLPREQQSESQIALFDGVIVPIQSRLEKLVEPPCGQSILAVFEKQ